MSAIHTRAGKSKLPRTRREQILRDLERLHKGEIEPDELNVYTDEEIVEARTWLERQSQASARAELRRPLPE